MYVCLNVIKLKANILPRFFEEIKGGTWLGSSPFGFFFLHGIFLTTDLPYPADQHTVLFSRIKSAEDLLNALADAMCVCAPLTLFIGGPRSETLIK